MFQPVAIDALANCSSRTSRCDRYTALAGSSPRHASTNTRSSPTLTRRVERPGHSSAAASSGMNLPEWSISPTPTSWATASTSPEPHMPIGSVSPITSSPISSSAILTPSIAPSAARIPHRIWAASNAGPAGAAVVSTRSLDPRAISELVPTSMNSRSRLSRVSPVASMPATMSPPTYAPSAGNAIAGARGCTLMPKSAAVAGGRLRAAMMNGATASGSGSIPSTSWVIVWLPHRTDLVHLGRIDTRLGADLPREQAEGLLGAGLQRIQRVGIHHRGRHPRDHVGAVGLLTVEHRAHRQRLAGAQVKQRRHHRGRAEVVGDGIAAVGGVAGLDVDQGVVHHHRGDLEVGAAKQRRELGDRAQHAPSARGRTPPPAAAPGRRPDPRGSARSARRSASAPPGAGSRDGRPRPAPPWGASAAAAPRPRCRPPRPPGRPAATPPASRRARTPGDRRSRSARCRDRILILHFLQVPWPPQVESIATPFHEAASKIVVPAGTRVSVPSGRNLIRTRPVPSTTTSSAALTLMPPPFERGGRRSSGNPIRRGRAGSRRRARRRYTAGSERP